MMNPYEIILIISFIMVFAIILFPRVSLRNHTTVTSEEIFERRPDLGSIKYKYNIPLVIIFLILLGALIFASSYLEISEFGWMFLFFPVLLFFGLYDGLFALLTGVFPATTRWNWNLFYYDSSERFRWLAQLQTTLAILGIMVSLAIFLLYKG